MDDPVYRSGKGDMPSTAPDGFAGDSSESEVNGSHSGRTEVREHCREWVPEKHNHCHAPAEFILWGKLIDPEGLGPRCYDHAAEHVGHHALAPHSGWAVFDLRGLSRCH